jgi:hypothetical protein
VDIIGTLKIIYRTMAYLNRYFVMPRLSLFVHACILSRGYFEIYPYEDRATQGCDPSAYGSRKAGRGADTFLGRPPYHFRVTGSAAHVAGPGVISGNAEK